MSYHYRKDGGLDMRYSSSKAAVGSGSSGSTSSGYSSGRPSSSGGHSSSFMPSGNDLHYKKDGTCDMRYSSSKAAVKATSISPSQESSGLHFKKDGTHDMRYSSSKEAVSKLGYNLQKLQLQDRGIPKAIPLTKYGLPDMRTREAKDWVMREGKHSTQNASMPAWLPRKKDGSLDTSKSVVACFMENQKHEKVPNAVYKQREQYYMKKQADNQFNQAVTEARRQAITIPIPYSLANTKQISNEFTAISQDKTLSDKIPSNIPHLDYGSLKASFGNEEENELGRGGFGVVLKGMLDGKHVAVKRLHLKQLTKKEHDSFVKEIQMLALTGEHPNIVRLIGYTLDPLCIVMEYVELGSLNFLIHYCEDPLIEAKMTDGRMKKRLIMGVVDGMKQLHDVGVVHGDLKPANVLVTRDYISKITDFGLATLRGKTTSSVKSEIIDDGENVIGGTGAYMAPELLKSFGSPQFSCDVYSFGILLNEVIQEMEPYSDQYMQFHGRGIYGVVHYAAAGNRPYIGAKTADDLKKMVATCWDTDAIRRPTFHQISSQIMMFDFPNSF